MPTSSLDTLLSCSIMILLVLSAMLLLSRNVNAGMTDSSYEDERCRRLAESLLLSSGGPSDWGRMSGVVPSSFGLASEGLPYTYQLDIDKVSRLNSGNSFSITYLQLLESWGVQGVGARIEMSALFDLALNLSSVLGGENETTYYFDVLTERSGLPVSAQLSCYVVAKNYLHAFNSSTASTGNGSLTVSIPNSANGTALLVAFAMAEPRMVAFDVYSFGHNSPVPEPQGTFLRLSPLNYTLYASFLYDGEDISEARVFTCGHRLNLTRIREGPPTSEYRIPSLLEPSPMILVATGLNGSSFFGEWTSYPQVPLEMGADLGRSDVGLRVTSLSYVVTVNSVLYRFNVKFGGASINHAWQ